jgi:hypothetical protein
MRLGYWVRGQLILMAVLAIATGVVYSVLGLPNALLLALLAGLAEATRSSVRSSAPSPLSWSLGRSVRSSSSRSRWSMS